jgi:hypothetical protein
MTVRNSRPQTRTKWVTAANQNQSVEGTITMPVRT